MKQLLFISLFIVCALVSAQEKRVLTIEECVEIAIENNLNIQRSALNLTSSEVALQQSLAQRYPTVNANGGFGYNWGRSIDPNSNLFVNQRINTNSIGARSSLPIWQGFSINNSIKQSRMDVQASELDLQRAKNDISLNVASFYLNVILNKELVENAEYQLESSRQQLERTKKLVASGALPIANELQLESQVATNEVTLINNQNTLDLSLLSLKQALLLPPGQEIDIVIPDISVDDSTIDAVNTMEVYEYALANQPEIKAAEARVKSSALALEASKGALYPSISLDGNINTNYSDAVDQIFVFDGGSTTQTVPTNLTTTGGINIVEEVTVPTGELQDYSVTDQWDDNLRYSVSVGVFVPILNGLNSRSNVQRAKIGLQQSEINAKEEQNTLYQNVETAYRNALAASRTYRASQKQVASLEESFRAIENQYNNGAAHFTDYQVAGNNLFQAQSDLSRAKYDFIFRQKILDFYLGNPLSF